MKRAFLTIPLPRAGGDLLAQISLDPTLLYFRGNKIGADEIASQKNFEGAIVPLQRFQKFYQVEFLLFSQAEIKVGVVMVHHIA